MKKDLSSLKKENPFKVPSGYFEGLASDILNNLPEKEIKETPVIRLWNKIRPWAYAAAMIAGVMLLFNTFVLTSSPFNQSGILTANKNISTTEIEEFYSFYEDQYTNALYRQTAYLDVE